MSTLKINAGALSGDAREAAAQILDEFAEEMRALLGDDLKPGERMAAQRDYTQARLSALELRGAADGGDIDALRARVADLTRQVQVLTIERDRLKEASRGR